MIGKKILRKFSERIDRDYLKKAGASGIPGSELGLLLLCYHPYHGKTQLEIPKGVTIAPGDQVAELHISNIKLTQITDNSSGGAAEWWQLLELAKGEFTLLARACIAGTIPEAIKAFYGVNVMPPLVKRLGFTLIPIPKGFNRWWLGFWESVLRKVYYSNNYKNKTGLKKTMDPYEIWISREELIRRYANESSETKVETKGTKAPKKINL